MWLKCQNRKLFSIYFESINIVQANFEFWLSATFAYILAFHFAGNNMSTYFVRMLQALYIMSVLVFVMNWFNSGMLALSMMELIESGNPDMVVRPIGGSVGPAFIVLLMVCGTAGALIYSIRMGKRASDGET